MSSESYSISILYASETGNTEDEAYALAKILRKRCLEAPVVIWSMENYDVTQLPNEKIAIFMVSTTGDGEHPHSMRSFWQYLLQKSLSPTSLENTCTAVFGFGDSSYEKYNACARRLAARLRQLSSRELVPLGLGDDSAQMGSLGSLNTWTNQLVGAISAQGTTNQLATTEISISNTAVALSPDEYAVTAVEAPASDCSDTRPEVRAAVEEYAALFSDSVKHRPHIQETERRSLAMDGKRGTVAAPPCGYGAYLPPDKSQCVTSRPFIAQVVQNDRLTAESWPQDVRAISLDFGSSLKSLFQQASCEGQQLQWPLFRAGDVVCVHPKNPKAMVDRMLLMVPSRCTSSVVAASSADGNRDSGGLSKDVFLSIKRLQSNILTGEKQRRNRLGSFSCTAHQLFTSHLDICGIPRRSFFAGLAEFATYEEEKEKLLELASPDGASLYYDYCLREKRSYVEVMEEFPSARPPIHKLLEILPLLQPRHYSVASSGYNGYNTAVMQLCVAVASSTTPYGRKVAGVCSTYLAQTRLGEEVVVWVRRGTFANPGLHVPLVLVGPGTGVAPMRALLQERRFLAECLNTSGGIDVPGEEKTHPDTLLFFGCRKRSNDFLYKEEWSALTSESVSRKIDPKDFFCDMLSPISEAVCVAFSQDGAENAPKTYVTHKLRLHGKLVAHLIDAGAHVYVAGSANKMPSDVRKAIAECLVEYSTSTATLEEAEKRLRVMERKKQYLVEAWS